MLTSVFQQTSSNILYLENIKQGTLLSRIYSVGKLLVSQLQVVIKNNAINLSTSQFTFSETKFTFPSTA